MKAALSPVKTASCAVLLAAVAAFAASHASAAQSIHATHAHLLPRRVLRSLSMGGHPPADKAEALPSHSEGLPALGRHPHRQRESAPRHVVHQGTCRGCGAPTDAARRRRRATARATPTPSAEPAAPARASAAGLPSACAARARARRERGASACAPRARARGDARLGERAAARCPRRMTGQAPTSPDAAARRPSG